MITRISIEGFKSFRKVDLTLGSFNLFIGTNASGKSNFLDALRVLQGIGYGFTIEEILNGKPKSAASDVWEAIRGGSARAAYLGDGTAGASRIMFEVEFRAGSPENNYRYMIQFSPEKGCLLEESLVLGGWPIFDSRPVEKFPSLPFFDVRYYKGTPGRQPHLSFEKSRPVLHQLLDHRECQETHKEHLKNCISALSNMQNLDPSPAVLREYSRAQSVRRMGERGENFASLVSAIVEAPDTKEAYISWLRQLTPSEFDDVVISRGALGEPLFAVREGGEIYHAPVLSDGTLRFAAITAAFFQPDMPEVITVEEIENGIHPTRLRLLVELLKSQSSGGGSQVMATSHSPIVLAWLREADFETTFFCQKDEESHATTITPLTEVRGFTDLIRKQPITDLFAEGWLEGAL